MEDLMLNEIWKYLPYNDIIKLCQTSYTFNHICKNNNVWIFLLQRDFDVIGDKDARKLYLRYREALLLFTKTFPIITDKALKYIVNDINYNEWQKIIDWELVEQRANGYFHYILSLSYLNNILDELGENVPYPTNYWINDIFLHNNAKIVLEKGCDEIIKIAQTPNIIYVKWIHNDI